MNEWKERGVFVLSGPTRWVGLLVFEDHDGSAPTRASLEEQADRVFRYGALLEHAFEVTWVTHAMGNQQGQVVGVNRSADTAPPLLLSHPVRVRVGPDAVLLFADLAPEDLEFWTGHILDIEKKLAGMVRAKASGLHLPTPGFKV